MGRQWKPYRNVDYLARQLETIWQEIPQHTIRNLYQSMTRRVAACIQARSDARGIWIRDLQESSSQATMLDICVYRDEKAREKCYRDTLAKFIKIDCGRRQISQVQKDEVCQVQKDGM
ncbi:hypothetical protein LAZ67_9003893 [Cordylochernes scorpioides]|uniref:Uncharacterized protein n=1 Tax=Cordylochernes scorpioides TaxID=51811 RepID=A0ABY6KUP7_9ARAC|nr:hypothetical protein LAZ67_9003893 [Cordylochernes scorpioides]